MSEHKATIRWKRTGSDFLGGKYSREHTWSFDGGVTVPASSSPSVVPLPYSNPASVDPEEAYVASISSCHMLTFLALAAKARIEVESYEDEAVGVMTKNERGVPWVSAVTLRPLLTFSGEKHPTPEEIESLHHRAHELCFIANSIKTEVSISKEASALPPKQPGTVSPDEPERAKIREVIATWLRASAEEDLDLVLTLMADDVVFLVPGRPPMRGREAFAAAARAMKSQFRIDGKPDIKEIEIAGRYAYCWNHLAITVTPLAQGQPMKRAGDVLSIFRKEPDGRWALFRDANLLVTAT